MFPDKGSWEECKLLINQLLLNAHSDIETLKEIQHNCDKTVTLNQHEINQFKVQLKNVEHSLESNISAVNTTFNTMVKEVDKLKISDAVTKTKLATFSAGGGTFALVVQQILEKYL